MISEFLKAFIALFVVTDPFAGIPVFLTLTRGFSEKHVKYSANRSIMVAALFLFIFLFLGINVLSFFNITLPSFQIAGGIILLIMGITYVLGIKLHVSREYMKDIAVPMGTPLITGPGVITTVIVLVGFYGYLIPFLAATCVLILYWVLLRHSKLIHKMIGNQGSEIMSRIMGLIISAISVQLIISGITSIFVGGT